jgi:ubiquitin-protein ligase E3 C
MILIAIYYILPKKNIYICTQSDFLKFVTSSSRQPLLGFEFLNPPFCIQKVPLDAAGQKLPSAGTCMSLLKLPEYRDKETMRLKILYAISSNAGFELS